MIEYHVVIEGLPELQRKLGETNFKVATKQGMENATTELERQIKLRTPHKSGDLMRAFKHKVSTDGMEGTIYNDVLGNYGPYVEYGTGVYIGKGRIYPRTKKALAWDGMVRRSVKGQKGQFFVKRSWEEEGGAKLLHFFTKQYDKQLSEG